MRNKTFYRVGSVTTTQGLWYNINGGFTGLIHNELSFCKNTKLQMPYDEKIIGYLSATRTLKELYQWFTKEDIKKLKDYGYTILKYRSNDYFYHNGHWLINGDSKLIGKGKRLCRSEITKNHITAQSAVLN